MLWGLGVRRLDFRFWALGLGPRALGLVLWAVGFGPLALASGLWGLGFGRRIWGFRHRGWGWGFGVQVVGWNHKHRVPPTHCRSRLLQVLPELTSYTSMLGDI